MSMFNLQPCKPVVGVNVSATSTNDFELKVLEGMQVHFKRDVAEDILLVHVEIYCAPLWKKFKSPVVIELCFISTTGSMFPTI